MYCVKCKKQTETRDAQYVVTNNGRSMLRGVCVVCRKTKTQFVKASAAVAQGGDLVSSLNAATSNIKLPWAKFQGELHLPGHQFTGPGTRLDLRLNPNETPKDWSKPINRVDSAAYVHDLAYNQHTDTASRNVADRAMINQLNNIPNPSLRERVERAIVKPILSAKTSLGLGLKKA